MKMKKLLLAAAAAPLMMFGQAYALDAPMAITEGRVSNITDCSLLTAAVDIKLSSNVHASNYCVTDGGTTHNMLFFGTCHESGSIADRSVTCTGTGEPHPDCTVADEVLTVTGRAAFLGSSDGGVITGLNLDADICDDQTIVSRVTAREGEIAAKMEAAQ